MSSYLYKIIKPACILFLLLCLCIDPASADNEVVLLIVNSSIYAGSGEIRSRIIRYEKEVEARTGFEILVETNFNGSAETAENLRSFLSNQYVIIQSKGSNLIGCVLVGEFPNAHYEFRVDVSGGYSHFPCDLFLMDLDGEWQDNETNAPMQKGIYDTHLAGLGDKKPEIFIGRIDASKMTGNETNILKRYFDKNHRYWSGKMNLTKYALTYVDYTWRNNEHFTDYIKYLYGTSRFDLIQWPNLSPGDYWTTRLAAVNRYDFIQIACHIYSEAGKYNLTKGLRLLC